MIFLNKEFEKAWAGKDPFEEADKLTGEVFRAVKTRRTLRFELNGKSYFAKIHHGVGWREIFKNLTQFKLPILGASNEWAALNKLKKLNVDTMTPCAFGIRGKNPAKQDSFIITEDLKDTISLEDFCRDWKTTPPPARLKWALIKKLAWVSRQMHTNGMNHRDYYICHFLLDISNGMDKLDTANLKAHLIDLHRAQIRSKTPHRWIVKDVAGIWFSSMDTGISKNDMFRFMRIYSGKSLRETLKSDRKFWLDVDNTARKLYKKEFSKEPDIGFNYNND
jgi:heptose I phosphotransferase